ncbi:exported hypothetical protein [Rhodospirillaceae bacterium LM-1]|nr:exported hypothetical protein [Rhodospirillaceae bacterium LM-1]
MKHSHLAFGAALLLFAQSFSAQAAESRFCLDYVNGACASPVLNGGQVRLESLSRNASGDRVLFLSSQQTASDGQILFHHWEMSQGARGRGGEAHRWIGVAPDESAKAALSAQNLGAGPAKASFGFTVKTGGQNYRLNSWRVIYGPGKVAAVVLGADGQPVGTPVTVEITE